MLIYRDRTGRESQEASCSPTTPATFSSSSSLPSSTSTLWPRNPKVLTWLQLILMPLCIRGTSKGCFWAWRRAQLPALNSRWLQMLKTLLTTVNAAAPLTNPPLGGHSARREIWVRGQVEGTSGLWVRHIDCIFWRETLTSKNFVTIKNKSSLFAPPLHDYNLII